VGVKYGIDAAEVFAQCLFAEVGSGIDEEGEGACLIDDRGAGAVVFRIGGLADIAIAADDRDPYGGSGAEESQRDAGHGRTLDGNGWADNPRDVGKQKRPEWLPGVFEK
jgi:hypothetical protein